MAIPDDKLRPRGDGPAKGGALSRLELKLPPDLLWFAVAALMWFGAALTPDLDVPDLVLAALAGLLFSAGVVFVVAGRVALRRAHTTWRPMRPELSTTLVTSGVYRYSRNPVYLGMLLALVAWAVLLADPVALLLTAVFVLSMNRLQIVPEERALIELAGDEFREYARRVRRWL